MAPAGQRWSDLELGVLVDNGLPINRNAFVFSDRPDYIFICAPGGLQVCPWTALRPAPKAADADAAIEEAINASRRLKLESTFQHGRLP
jgi:hypothetical protein